MNTASEIIKIQNYNDIKLTGKKELKARIIYSYFERNRGKYFQVKDLLLAFHTTNPNHIAPRVSELLNGEYIKEGMYIEQLMENGKPVTKDRAGFYGLPFTGKLFN